jgi:hypothetical protein
VGYSGALLGYPCRRLIGQSALLAPSGATLNGLATDPSICCADTSEFDLAACIRERYRGRSGGS